MGLLERVGSAQGVKLICGVRLFVRPLEPGKLQQFIVELVEEGEPRAEELVLLGLLYYSHVLSRYPKDRSETYELGTKLRQMIAQLLEEGIWSGSNLIGDAGVAEQMVLVEDKRQPTGWREIQTALIKVLPGQELDLALEVPAGVSEPELILSVIAVLQALVKSLPSPGIDLLDKALRYLHSYHDEGADFADPAAARNLASRAMREAGGELF